MSRQGEVRSPAPKDRGADPLLADRYGRGRTGRGRLLVVLAVVLALVGGGWLAWAVWLESNPEVQSGLLRSQVVDAHHVTADVQVAFGSHRVVADCVLQAMAADHSVVGELNFHVGPAAGRQVVVRKQMRTERTAVVVDLVGCTTPDQPKPR